MPEGPEVRRYADALHGVLADQPILQLSARTKAAKRWLQTHAAEIIDRQIVAVTAHGKNLIGWIEDEYYFYSHLMMWGSWQTFAATLPVDVDRRERARIAVPTGGAILYSAPVFELGQGDPYAQVEVLKTLGPDILPIKDNFDRQTFQGRLMLPIHQSRAIGAALLDQTIVAGIGNYLRAEILFECRLDPWRLVQQLSQAELERLCQTMLRLAERSYQTGGVTVPDELRSRMEQDASLVYRLGSEFGTRHFVFRRTNLPCLVCGTGIKQARQAIHSDEAGEKTRIIYFCPVCQNHVV